MIEVEVPCSCPGTPHEGDTVSIPDVADVRIGMAVMSAYNNAPADVDLMEGLLSTAFVHASPRAWSFIDEEGEPLPVSVENIDARLTWNMGGAEVASRASALYAGDVFAPLVRLTSKGSPRGRTPASTSPNRQSRRSTRSSSKPSLRAVTDGKPSEARAS